MRLKLAYTFLFLAVAGAACSGKPAADPNPKAQRAASQPANPSADNGVRVVSGTVAETMNAASYTYVRVRTADGDVWAASSEFPVAVGDRVRVPLQMAMKDFHSKTLNRDFPKIYFVTQIQREGQAGAQAPSPAGAMMPSHGAASPSASSGAPGALQPATPTIERMEPPPGGMSIANVWAKRASLAGKNVTVRGKVVKFNGEIMGRNWMHIQDGTGDAKDGSNDLTVTSQGVAKVGDVITATGTLAVDKDFGAGYAYKAIVEGATIRQ
jgi:hypothetical protein